jgi:predicted nucleic acid-binding protein
MMLSPFLIDTNVLLRLFKADRRQYPQLRAAINQLAKQGIGLAYTLQNLTEFWNVSTETEQNVREVEIHFTFLPDNEDVYREWRRIVFEHNVMGAQVHDARLAAAMSAHKLTHILTLNGSDFKRFPGITSVHPDSV